ncbi:PepSY domain-containing protein [Kushneria pakistanensis]|nr:peptidase [Kushneria pakistanensis]
MDSLRLRLPAFFCLTMLSVLVGVANACPEEGRDVSQDEVLKMTEDGSIEPFPIILEKARDHRRGKLLEAKLDCVNKRYVYEIDMLDHDGQIRALRFDAVTGRHLDLEED